MSEAEKVFLIVMGTGISLTALGMAVGRVLRNSVEAHIYEVASYGEEDQA